MTDEETTSLAAAPDVVGSFLVGKGLYSKFQVQLSERVLIKSRFYPRSLRRGCESCKMDTNWETTARKKMGTPIGPMERGPRMELDGFAGADLLSYQCIQCRVASFVLWVVHEWHDAETVQTSTLTNNGPTKTSKGKYASQFELRKVGQYPPFSISPRPEVEAALDPEDVELYKRALMNCSTGFGIGAVAYFRRVVENEVSRLLDTLDAVAKDDDDEGLAKLIATAKAGHNADERLRLAADATPQWLRVGGHNPLALLYGHFSTGVHALNDEACLELASKLQAAFEAVLAGVRMHRQQQEDIARALT